MTASCVAVDATVAKGRLGRWRQWTGRAVEVQALPAIALPRLWNGPPPGAFHGQPASAFRLTLRYSLLLCTGSQ